jgi:tRNA (cmo5U34)-methyltransferase
LELKAKVELQPNWSFIGVDPSAAMLDLARSDVWAIAQRVELVEGLADDVSPAEFDGAKCLLVLHLLNTIERLHTLKKYDVDLNSTRGWWWRITREEAAMRVFG